MRYVKENNAAAFLVQLKQSALAFLRAGAAGLADGGRAKRQVALRLVDETQRHRDHLRAFCRLAGRGRTGLFKIERESAGGGIMGPARSDDGRARLIVPAHELREVAARRFRKAGDEILDRRSRAVAARKVEVHSLAKSLIASQAFQRADDLRAFLVDRRRVEIIDLMISFRPHVMCQRAGVFAELRRSQRPHVGDALDGARALVG